jgi:linoleoyl-CoA desaturase
MSHAMSFVPDAPASGSAAVIEAKGGAGLGGVQRDPGRHPKFHGPKDFQTDLHERVDAYFAQTGKPRRDLWQMYVKTAFYLLGFAGSYAALVTLGAMGLATWWNAIPLAIVVGLFIAGIGMNVQHDGSHQAFSERGWVNRLMAMSLELIGGSSYYWRFQHTILHHTYTNVSGHDHDVDVGVFGRLTPHQRHLKVHRFQHLYMWFLYAFMALRWQVWGDFEYFLRGKIGAHPVPRPKGLDLAVFVLGKAMFFTLAFVLPMALLPTLTWTGALAVVGLYALAGGTLGLVLAVVFQLAHAVEDAAFVVPTDRNRIDNAWAIHQVESTVDFARHNPVACFLLGGLNHQVEHHLMPRICHLHYPALSRIVEETCADHGITYNNHGSFWSGIVSHYRWLKRMGTGETAGA